MANRNKNKSFANFILAFGLFLILVGIFLLVDHSEHATRVFAFRPVLLLVSGAVFLFVSFAFTENGYTIFVGLYAVFMGIIFLLIDTHIIPYSFRELWPTVMIGCSFSLLPAVFYKFRRISSVYLFPALMICVLGVVFLMFSMHIFPFTFRHFIMKWWPFLIILGGASLIFIYLLQQSGNKKFPYMKDDSLVHGDDEC
ncbi:MAG: DUF5668 domain-containing protein [Treponema sp.]|nr:DUF5668 domain-containing protein [Treponema sp.]